MVAKYAMDATGAKTILITDDMRSDPMYRVWMWKRQVSRTRASEGHVGVLPEDLYNDFATFKDTAPERPDTDPPDGSKRWCLDRTNNLRGYEDGNMQWLTSKQHADKSNNIDRDKDAQAEVMRDAMTRRHSEKLPDGRSASAVSARSKRDPHELAETMEKALTAAHSPAARSKARATLIETHRRRRNGG